MRDLRVAAWLVRKVALRGPGSRLPAFLLAIGMAAIVLLGLSSVSALQVVSIQQERAATIVVSLDSAQEEGTSDDLRMIDPRVTNTRRWNGHEISRQSYAVGRSSLVAPGLSVMPQPGEFYASPDLADLIAQDPVVASVFSSQRLVGSIGQAGLVQPHELRAIVGVGDNHPLLTKVDGFGRSPTNEKTLPDVNTQSHSDAVLNLGVTAYVLALVWIPAMFFVVVLSRLTASRRRQRSRTLHMIGYSKWRIWILHFVEAAFVCVPAAILGCVVHRVGAHRLTALPGTAFGFFSADTQISLSAYFMVSALLVVATCLTVSSDRWQSRSEQPRRRGRARSVPRLGLVTLGTGLLLLVVPSLLSLHGVLTPVAMWIGLVLAAVGIATAGPRLVMITLAARAARAPAPRLAGRKMAAYEVTTALRLASLMSVIIVLLLGSESFATVVNGGSAQHWEQRAAAYEAVPIIATDLSGTVALDQVSSIDPLGAATELRAVETDGEIINVAFTTCERLHRLVGSRNDRDCPGSDQPQWLGPTPNQNQNTQDLTLSKGKVIELPPPTNNLEIPGLPDTLTGALMLSPNLASNSNEFSQNGVFFLVAPPHNVTQILAGLSSIEPTLQFDLGPLDRHNPDTQRFPAQVDWLAFGAAVSLAIGFLCLIVASLSEAQDRRWRMRALRAIGASRRQLLTVHLWCVAAPLALLGTAAIAVGWLVAQAMGNIDERAAVVPSHYALLLLLVLVGSIVVSATSWPAVTRPSQKSGSLRT